MDPEKYLQRISYQGGLTPNLETLRQLQYHHLQQVAFENLDIHLGRPIILDIDKLYVKVVEQGRGGFCYELNGLFYELLKSLGYEVKMVSARVHNSARNTFGPEFDHMALIVQIDGKEYLTDVGFGKFAYYPLEIALDKIVTDGGGIFKMDTYQEDAILVSKQTSGGWNPEYLFTPRASVLADFAEMCYYQQTSPDSHFTQNTVCSIQTPAGRTTLSGNTVKFTTETGIEEITFDPEKELNETLWKYFKMKLV